MKAEVGDLVVVASRKLLGQVRVGEVIAVGDSSGGGPYRVRWSDDGRETLFFPGPDAHVEHPAAKQPDARTENAADKQ
jgi:hypothetical protein